ncbi:MAG: HEAT repeat domain-containing protein [Dehalococcoidales bacterium]
MPLSDVIECLRGGDKVTDALLIELSGLDGEELAALQMEWARVASERRRQILGRMVTLAADDVRLSFEGVFRERLDDTDAEVRRRAIEGLSECEDAWLIKPLVHLLTRDSSEAVRVRAAEALGRFAVLAECGHLPTDRVEMVTRALLDTVEPTSAPIEVGCQALESVAALSLPEVTAAIMRAYQEDDDRLQLSAVRAMGRSCDPSWLPMLLKEVASRDPELRREAVTALGQLGEEDAVACLADLIYDDDVRVRLATVRALGEIGGPEAVEALEQALPDAEAAVTDAAEETLESLADLDDRSGQVQDG